MIRASAYCPSMGQAQPATLGDLLFSRSSTQHVSEREWTALVQAITEGDPGALRALYSRLHRIVFTFLLKLTRSREAAEELIGDVFYEVWRRPSVFNASRGSVTGWTMNLARARAIDRLWFEQRRNRSFSPEAVPGGLVPPPALLWARLGHRIAAETGIEVPPEPASVTEADREDAGPGVSYQILARDVENERVSMLVRLAPGAAYPPHTHAGIEELYLLDGELVIDDRKLHPGAYNRVEAGTGDQHVWSEGGCTCVLLTSTNDILRAQL